MSQNQFLPLATGAGANTVTAAQFAAQGFIAQGFQSGEVKSTLFNTVLRQLSTVTTAIAQFTADNQSADVLDDGLVASFESKFGAALRGALSASSVHYGLATGTNDALVVTAVPALQPSQTAGYQPGSFLIVKTMPSAANATTTPTINANSIAPITITKRDGSAVAKGDLPPGTWITLFFDGQGCYLVNLALSDIISLFPASALWHTGADTSNTAGSIVVSAVPAVTTRQPMLAYLVYPARACTGATTINVGFGTQPLCRMDGTAVQAGDFAANQPLVCFDDGTTFRAQTRQSNYYVDTSSSPSMPTIASPIAQFSDGIAFRIKMKLAPTGPSTLYTANLSAPITRRAGAAMVGNEWAAGDIIELVYSSTSSAFQIAAAVPSDIAQIAAQVFGTPMYQLGAGSGNYTPGPGITRLKVRGVAPGGAGGATNNSSAGGTVVGNAGGGGGGGAFEAIIACTPGVAIPWSIGALGPSTPNAAGGSGGSLAFGSVGNGALITATGGTGGPFGASSIGQGGAGGTVTFSGSNVLAINPVAGGIGGASGTNDTGAPNQSEILNIYGRGGLAGLGFSTVPWGGTGAAGNGLGTGGNGASGGSGLAGGAGAQGALFIEAL